MNSQKLQQFITTHTPATVVWDVAVASSQAYLAGLEVNNLPSGGIEFVSCLRKEQEKRENSSFWRKLRLGKKSVKKDDFNKIILEKGETMEVSWFPYSVGEFEVSFVPQVTGGRSIFEGWRATSTIKRLEDNLGKVKIFLPEQVVELPLPNWVEAYMPLDVNPAALASEKMFISEAAGKAAEFIKKLQLFIQEMDGRLTSFSIHYNNGSGFYDPDPNGHGVLASSPEEALNKIQSFGFPDRVVTLFGENPNVNPSAILARD